MVRKQTKVDISWFAYTPDELVLGQVKQVLRKYRLKLPDFKKYLEGKRLPIIEYPNGDLELGCYSKDLRRFLRSRLIVKR